MQDISDLEPDIAEEAAPTSEPQAKWGDAIKAGYQVLPDALLRGQRLLKLTATDIVVIANLNQAWWYSDRLPYLQPHTIAKRMGVSERSVQRSLRRLRGKRLLRQVRERHTILRKSPKEMLFFLVMRCSAWRMSSPSFR